jgi:serine/threonine-protein kinase
MARIYRAEHEGLQRHVALKVLSPSFAQDAEGRERFVREARIAAAIKHPNVVNIFDVGVQDGLPYLVMELLEGEDLEALLRRRGALTETTIVDILVPIVAGLVAVHDAGVVHRDLKPGNIFLARGRDEAVEPRLLDFGISRSVNAEAFRLTLANGLLMGTPMYMSPEAIRGEEVTALSDQYSVGVLLYECATGINPFASDSLADTMRRVTSGRIGPPSEHNPRLSPRLVRIILRAMHLDPAQRFADLRSLGRELLLLAGQRTRITWSLSFGDPAFLSATERPVRPDASLSEAERRRSRRLGRWVGLAAVCFGVVSVVALAGFLWLRGLDETAQGKPTTAATTQQALQPGVGRREAAAEDSASQGDSPGSDSPGSDSPGSDSPGRDSPGSDSPGSPGSDSPGSDSARENSLNTEAADDGSAETSGAERDDSSEAVPAPRRRQAPRPRARVQSYRPRNPPVAVAAPPPPESAPESPDWVVPIKPRDARPSSKRLGTNNAPILD